MPSTFVPAPNRPGAYRWYYLDARCGDWTVVIIFMLGAQFNTRYSVAARRGGRPSQHCAVNLAIYRAGRRSAWAFSEYGAAELTATALRVGRSTLRWEGDVLRATLREQTAPRGPELEAELTLRSAGTTHAPVELLRRAPHWWHPVLPRAEAVLRLPQVAEALVGQGYHDSNFGEEALGGSLRGWDWSREHGPTATRIRYHPWDGGRTLLVAADAQGVLAQWSPTGPSVARLTRWGLRVPADAPPNALESSPFYARFEGQAAERHVLLETADFRRFHKPWVRWMAAWRTRDGGAP